MKNRRTGYVHRYSSYSAKGRDRSNTMGNVQARYVNYCTMHDLNLPVMHASLHWGEYKLSRR